jgi:hypothetical protein
MFAGSVGLQRVVSADIIAERTATRRSLNCCWISRLKALSWALERCFTLSVDVVIDGTTSGFIASIVR